MSDYDFVLHPQLARDCHELGRHGAIRVLLHRSRALPWVILVPESSATEMHDLDPGLRRALEETADVVARHLKAEGCDKINVAAIGNLVPQLHYHVVGRRRDDPAWPGVVWGRLPDTQPRADAEVATLRGGLVAAGLALT